MSNPVLEVLSQQLQQGEQAKQEWATCFYVEHANADVIRFWHREGYQVSDTIKRGVDEFWSRCVGRNYQIMPGCEGVLLSDQSNTSWIVYYHVDMRQGRIK